MTREHRPYFPDPAERARQTIVPAALDVLRGAGLTVEGDDEPYRVQGGKFLFWPTTGLWRSADGTQQGYTAGRLAEASRTLGGMTGEDGKPPSSA